MIELLASIATINWEWQASSERLVREGDRAVWVDYGIAPLVANSPTADVIFRFTPTGNESFLTRQTAVAIGQFTLTQPARLSVSGQVNFQTMDYNGAVFSLQIIRPADAEQLNMTPPIAFPSLYSFINPEGRHGADIPHLLNDFAGRSPFTQIRFDPRANSEPASGTAQGAIEFRSEGGSFVPGPASAGIISLNAIDYGEVWPRGQYGLLMLMSSAGDRGSSAQVKVNLNP